MASKLRVPGVTNSLDRRVLEHKNDVLESYDDVRSAIVREKQLKGWNRTKKVWLIQTLNPTWEDLAEDFGQPIKQQVPRLVG